MRCVPEQKRKLLVDIVIGALIALCAAAFTLTRIAEHGRAVCLLAGWLSIFAVLYIAARYRMAGFVYSVRPRGDEDTTELAASYASLAKIPFGLLDLAVYRVFPWRDPIAQCVLSLDELKEATLVGSDTGAKREIVRKYKAENGGRFAVYDYTLTPWTGDALMLVFADGERYIGVLLEADDQMREFFEVIG